MQYGFVIDQDKCIGCHACTTACKQENGVPLGSFRTWVKYVEKGTYPQVKRHFLVQRCNQCSKPPCVDICPVGALSKRGDGIVDVDRDACIGCRACMQACPYDALYLNEDLGAVEKCHFCAHRVEVGLAPACVNVCPVGAIIPGDFHDPESRVSLIRRESMLRARRVEQKTGPNVWYIGADSATLEPGEATPEEMFLWSDRPGWKPEVVDEAQGPRSEVRGGSVSVEGMMGLRDEGSSSLLSGPSSQSPRPRTSDLGPSTGSLEALNAEHKIEWGWPVALYLVTKGIAGGVAMVAPFLSLFGLDQGMPWWFPEATSLAFVLVTVALLIEDLKKPKHFYKLFTRPNWKSWLVKGGIVLTAFGGVSALILAAGLFGQTAPTGLTESLRWLNALLGAATAGYTAFLFAQCKGRDLWESRMLLPHLLIQAWFCGVVVLMPFASSDLWPIVLLMAPLAMHFGFVHHDLHRTDTNNARQASRYLATARIGAGTAMAASAMLLVVGVMVGFLAPAVAFVPVLIGLFLYEQAYVRAGQLPPLS
ncbi:MAG: polysulfide reductase NrfD [Armatimonadetes bacterium]|nr:polysulfide reductase NrfD [Armatimonadota bacterium]